MLNVITNRKQIGYATNKRFEMGLWKQGSIWKLTD